MRPRRQVERRIQWDGLASSGVLPFLRPIGYRYRERPGHPIPVSMGSPCPRFAPKWTTGPNHFHAVDLILPPSRSRSASAAWAERGLGSTVEPGLRGPCDYDAAGPSDCRRPAPGLDCYRTGYRPVSGTKDTTRDNKNDSRTLQLLALVPLPESLELGSSVLR